MEQVERLDQLPGAGRICPKCGAGWCWVPYYLIEGAPAAACRRCGYLIYLTKKAFAVLTR
jgi:ribosomal protein L40E